MAGYSKKPLWEKLNLSSNLEGDMYGYTKDYFELIGKEIILNKESNELNFLHIFIKSIPELKDSLELINRRLSKRGFFWISWPKKSSKLQSDLDENIIRDFFLENQFVDVKVCAIDETWSGLKFYLRKELR